MKPPVAILGVGQLGGVFARGFLRCGHPVLPVTRETDVADMGTEPALVLVCVGEGDLDDVLGELPVPWRSRLGLVQNELLPPVWEKHGIEAPTVAVVWFEKKRRTPVTPLLPTPVHGPHAAWVTAALDALDIPCRCLAKPADLLFELVLKNVYVLTINIAGLTTGGTVGKLWGMYPRLAEEVASQVIDIQARLAGRSLARGRLLDRLAGAFEASPEHTCTGRSAPERLGRAIEAADRFGLGVPRLREIQAQIGS